MIEILAQESDDLGLHVKLCAQRYHQIIDKLEHIDRRLDRIDSTLEAIRQTVSAHATNQLRTYIGWAGFIITTLIGLVVYLAQL